MTKSLVERRRFKRFDTNFSITLNNDELNTLGEIVLSKNLSREGLKVKTTQAVDMGAIVDIHIMIPDDNKPVLAAGRVVWVHPSEQGYELGVKFLMMDPSDKFRVLDYAYNRWVEHMVDNIASASD
jgi:hypothetical protein